MIWALEFDRVKSTGFTQGYRRRSVSHWALYHSCIKHLQYIARKVTELMEWFIVKCSTSKRFLSRSESGCKKYAKQKCLWQQPFGKPLTHKICGKTTKYVIWLFKLYFTASPKSSGKFVTEYNTPSTALHIRGTAPFVYIRLVASWNQLSSGRNMIEMARIMRSNDQQIQRTWTAMKPRQMIYKNFGAKNPVEIFSLKLLLNFSYLRKERLEAILEKSAPTQKQTFRYANSVYYHRWTTVNTNNNIYSWVTQHRCRFEAPHLEIWITLAVLAKDRIFNRVLQTNLHAIVAAVQISTWKSCLLRTTKSTWMAHLRMTSRGCQGRDASAAVKPGRTWKVSTKPQCYFMSRPSPLSNK